MIGLTFVKLEKVRLLTRIIKRNDIDNINLQSLGYKKIGGTGLSRFIKDIYRCEMEEYRTNY